MSKLGVVEDTLFVPMLGRIYASEYCPQILYDPKALELKKKLPSGLPEQDGQSQYTLLASAARSANMDRYIRAFLERRPDGVIVQLGCGLETAYYRCDNGRFAEDWIRQIRADVPDAPILVTAGGLFHYFEESKVVGLLRMLTGFGEIEIEIVFDSVSKSGMAMMRKKYMKQVGHGDAQMFFYVDSASVLAGKIGSGVRVLAEEPYYRHIPRTGLKLSTKISMSVSDRFCMVKMVHLCHSAKFHD